MENELKLLEESVRQDENDRLAELYSLRVLDSPREDEYDTITELTARFFSAPAAMISFVDRDRQWIKARFGIEVRETHRKMSVCSYGIQSAKPFVIEDVLLDRRYSNTLLMQMQPNYRFYAGAPLTTCNGYRVGMLCIMDTEPRTLDEQQLRYLERFARLIVNMLETRRLISDVLDQVRAFREVQERMDEMTFRIRSSEISA